MFALHEQIKYQRLQSYRGRIVPVLVEGPSKHDPAMLSGRTDDNFVVNFVADPATPLGSMLGVRIDQAQPQLHVPEEVALLRRCERRPA